jgi:hypothetical protein
MPKLVDTILGSNVLFTRFVSKAKKWRGEKLKFPVKYAKNVTGGSFAGFDTFSVEATNNRVNMEYEPKFYKITVALPLDELSVNATEDKVLDLAATEIASATQDMADDLGTIFYSDGTGNNSKDPLGLAALVDDGTTVATIGGLSRATYTTLASTKTASGGSLSLTKMSTLYRACGSGAQKPTIGYCNETVEGLYESLLEPAARIARDVSTMKGVKEIVGGAGFTAFFYKGMPILADEKATAQTLIFLNENEIDWYALPVFDTQPIKFKSAKIEGNDYDSIPTGLGFSWSGWIKPANSATLICHIYLGGNLVTKNPKRHGKLTGITTV